MYIKCWCLIAKKCWKLIAIFCWKVLAVYRAIAYYYNYAITTPFYGELDGINEYHQVQHEEAKPGYYSVWMNGIHCELTTDSNTAYHRYKFPKGDGRLAIDFSSNGLHPIFGEDFYSVVKDISIEKIMENEIAFSGIFSGIKLYFSVWAEAKNIKSKLFIHNSELDETKICIDSGDERLGVVFDFEGNEIILKVSYSTINSLKAKEQIKSLKDGFDDVARNAYMIWNQYLSFIKIDSNDENLKKKFYSNFYHSIIKPVDMHDESVMGIKGDLVTDFATFWDQYKTLFPLIFMLYPNMANKIAKAIINISRTRGHILCSLGISDKFPCEEQAKALGIRSLCDAFYFGLESVSKEYIDECFKRELKRDDYEEFRNKGTFERYTHIIDVTDVCLAVADITDDEEFRRMLLKYAKNWKKAYDEDGLMSKKSLYYEGDRYTYSFRLQNNMDERIEYAGGKDKFTELLDDFFGFDGDSIQQIREFTYENFEKIMEKYHRFEGFNNECDMETPYAYIYVGKHEKTCEIIHESINKSYALGIGALPGNNDSGALSSCFLWNVLRIYPVSGSGKMLLGTPHIDNAKLRLSNGKELAIETINLTEDSYYVSRVEFNGKEITDFRLNIQDLMKGGRLVFHMYSNNEMGREKCNI